MSLRVVDAAADAAAEAGLSLLDRRAVTESQMRDYLAAKGFGETAIDDVVAAFAARGWLNDRDYTVEFLRQRCRRPGMSRAKLVADLEKRGLDTQSITAGIAALDAEDPEWETENARTLLESKLAAARRGLDLSNFEDFRKLKAKLWRYVATRGFSTALATTVVNAVLDDLKADGLS
ncbi:regulatory protein RecX [Mobiluncus curtisii]|uniref:Regulatory protein RecX n=1 Tax=Mobiluncus curtisii TaxID=2051 RepID=A0A7Y0UID9_9ACTO|nr:regulatory protein RecX [Mobiluncus curtisii]EFL94399.1 regulatory protein RecX [Mobiluncus curtisii subsp. curtisii ATCC 35241]MCU9987546.1 regulatory protein RecX [Mobiluncus curtisii]MCV0000379.1 regulatory protein RecX [Mobiluncus curtisii]NMW46027.1 regulatory protein RecX [Mobiluncus curtisii]NMW49435.1 regulatory protein RecX [Mobiluncus curtisii]